jgi:hypothetical protein
MILSLGDMPAESRLSQILKEDAKIHSRIAACDGATGVPLVAHNRRGCASLFQRASTASTWMEERAPAWRIAFTLLSRRLRGGSFIKHQRAPDSRKSCLREEGPRSTQRRAGRGELGLQRPLLPPPPPLLLVAKPDEAGAPFKDPSKGLCAVVEMVVKF